MNVQTILYIPLIVILVYVLYVLATSNIPVTKPPSITSSVNSDTNLDSTVSKIAVPVASESSLSTSVIKPELVTVGTISQIPVLPIIDKHPEWAHWAVSCSSIDPKGNSGNIYRYDGDSTLNWYPTPDIAVQYDTNWATGATRKLDCTGMTLGPDMVSLIDKHPEWKDLAITCSTGNPKGDNPGYIYRYDGNSTIRFYPTPDIAVKYDPDYNSGLGRKLDCTNMTLGPDMPPLDSHPEWKDLGVSCSKNDPKGDNSGAIYRYDGSTGLNWYPNPEIAQQYDQNWASGANRKLDCANMIQGPDIQPTKCGPGNVLDGASCYPVCKTDYSGAGPVCYANCPGGWTDFGAGCTKPPSYGNGAGTIPPFEPCPDGGYDVGGTCWHHNYKTSWGSVGCTGGRPFTFNGYSDCYSTDTPYISTAIGDRKRDCPAGQENVAGLCYNTCKPGFHFFGGNVCTPDCPTGFTDSGVSCTKPSYGRGAGFSPNTT